MVFAADIEDLYGMGNLANTLAQNQRDAKTVAGVPSSFQFTERYQTSEGINVTGIISIAGIDEAIALFASKMTERLSSRSNGLDYVAYELKRAAWRYSATDRSTADKLADEHSKITNYGGVGYTGYDVDPIANATQFPAGDMPDTSVPEFKQTDVRALIDQSQGILTDLDQNIRKGTKWFNDNVTPIGSPNGWSPLEQTVGPLLGNWAELERSGECFSKAGTASESNAETFSTGNTQLLGTWTGDASEAYADHAGRLAKAMAWEGPIGRIAEAVLVATSEQAQAAATSLLTYLNTKFKEVIIDKGLRAFMEAAVTKLMPGIGWFTLIRDAEKLYDLGTDIWNIYKEAVDMIKKIEQLLADANAVLEALQNPQEAAANEIQQRVDKVKEQIEQRKEQLELGADIVQASDVTAITNAPKDPYAALTGAPAWEDS